MAKVSVLKTNFLTLEEGFNYFLKQARARNLSAATIRSYKENFKYFTDFYSGNLTDINNEVIINFVEYLQKRGIKPTSINTVLRHLKAVLNFFKDNDFIRQPLKIKFLKVNEAVKDCYTDEELLLLLKKPDLKKVTFAEYRTWVMINFLIGTGCRISTLVNIRVGDIDFENELIAYRHTKNKRLQYIPLAKQLAKVIWEYLQLRSDEWDENSLLFPSENNTVLKPNTVSHLIASYNRKRGVKKTSAHLFRHTFAKNWILQGGDPLKLQKVLGHQSLTMVQHYANLYKADLKRGFEDFSLLGKFTNEKITLQKRGKR